MMGCPLVSMGKQGSISGEIRFSIFLNSVQPLQYCSDKEQNGGILADF